MYYGEISESQDLTDLERILEGLGTKLTVTHGFVATHVNLAEERVESSRNTFQTVLATDGEKLYAVITYFRLDGNHPDGGFFDSWCPKQAGPIDSPDANDKILKRLYRLDNCTGKSGLCFPTNII